MTVIATKADLLSEVLVDDVDTMVFNYNYQQVALNFAVDDEVTIGTVLVWDETANRFLVLGGADGADASKIATADPATGDTGVTVDLAKMCVVVGTDDAPTAGIGNGGAITVTAAEREVTVLFRGQASVKYSGLIFGGTAPNAGNKLLITQQLEKQGIKIVDTAVAVATLQY